MNLTLNTDGGARGNPGPAAIGAVIKDENGSILEEIGKYIGKTTNNVAEYQALIAGLSFIKQSYINAYVTCYLDSELVVKQVRGEYKVRDANLKQFWEQVKRLEKDLHVTYTHVPREKNSEADKLVNKVLDSQ